MVGRYTAKVLTAYFRGVVSYLQLKPGRCAPRPDAQRGARWRAMNATVKTG